VTLDICFVSDQNHSRSRASGFPFYLFAKSQPGVSSDEENSAGDEAEAPLFGA